MDYGIPVHHVHPGRSTSETRKTRLAWLILGMILLVSVAVLIAWMFERTPPPLGAGEVDREPQRFRVAR